MTASAIDIEHEAGPGPETWSNWSGSVRCSAARVATPADEAELARLVREAAAAGQSVRAVGSGHSFSPLVATDGVIVCLDGLRGVLSCDAERQEAWIAAGSKLHELGEPLRRRGLAMKNMGDIDVQSLAGALSTGTHGTGRELANLPSQVRALRWIDAEGGSVEVGEDDDADLLRADRVSLGLLGVTTQVRLGLVPAYRLHERLGREPIEECLAAIDERIAATRHFEFFWFPGPDRADTKAIHPTEAEPGAWPERHERIGWSFQILPSVRELKFFEMEYAVPAEVGVECFREVRERIRARHPDVQWPVEFRTLARDDAWLSPAHERATVTISVHQDGHLPYRDFFADVEAIFVNHRGRPHWGKIHRRTGAELRDLYPRFDDFAALRQRLDPKGRFLNPYLRSLFEV